MQSCLPLVGLGHGEVDGAPAQQQGFCQVPAISLAVGGQAQLAEVAVGGFAQLRLRCGGDPAQRVVHGAAAGDAAMREDHLADEVDAALDGLRDGLAGVEPGVQVVGQEGLDLALPGGQLFGALV
ncbi:hypothetical protein D9M69_591180 [compost metagenome]